MQTQVYHDASEWEPWTDAVRYEPTEQDRREASQLFGELEDALDVAEFLAVTDFGAG